MISSSDKEDIIKTSPSAPMNSSWTETLGTGRAGWEKNWNFDRIFLEEQGVHKKNGAQF